MLKLGVDVIELERIAISAALRNRDKRPVRVGRDVDYVSISHEIIWDVREFDELDVLGIGLVKVSDSVGVLADLGVCPRASLSAIHSGKPCAPGMLIA